MPVLILISAIIGFDLMFVMISCLGYFIAKRREEKESKRDSMQQECPQPKPNVLTQDQIDDIHSRGKLTPDEKAMEWESFDLCAPGDAIGSASWRCKKFRNCRECLVAYARELNTEFESMPQNFSFHL